MRSAPRPDDAAQVPFFGVRFRDDSGTPDTGDTDPTIPLRPVIGAGEIQSSTRCPCGLIGTSDPSSPSLGAKKYPDGHH